MARRSGPEASRKTRELFRRPLHHARPVVEARLSKQPGGRVPWAVVAAEKPAPVGSIRQQYPHRLAKRPCEMNRCAVDRDDQIQRRDDRGGIHETLERVAEIPDLRI